MKVVVQEVLVRPLFEVHMSFEDERIQKTKSPQKNKTQVNGGIKEDEQCMDLVRIFGQLDVVENLLNTCSNSCAQIAKMSGVSLDIVEALALLRNTRN